MGKTTKEEAEKALSPAGRRMAGCFREAETMYYENSFIHVQDRDGLLIKIAFQLFNTED